MQTKLAITLSVIMLALIALIAAIYYLVRNNSEEYNKIVLSQRQASYDSRTIPFRRGDIMDRNGTVLATSQKVYNLIIDPRVIHSGQDDRYVDATIQALVSFFEYDETEPRTLITEKADKSYVKYAKGLSYDQKSGWEAYVKEQNAAYTSSGSKARIKGIWFDFANGVSFPIFGDFMEFLTDRLMIPLCALGVCIFTGWIWKPENAVREIELDGKPFKLAKVYGVLVKYVAPISILLIIVASFVTGTTLS